MDDILIKSPALVRLSSGDCSALWEFRFPPQVHHGLSALPIALSTRNLSVHPLPALHSSIRLLVIIITLIVDYIEES
jgi:hypothetical protein